MRLTFLLATALLVIVGCTAKEPPPWHHSSLDLTDVEALTLVVGAYYLDGGTTVIYAITDSGMRCSIRLNQHLLPGEYELGTLESPGRLCFNEKLIDVRSSDEQHLIALLESAIVTPLQIDNLRRLRDLDTVSPSDFDNLGNADYMDEIQRLRKSVIEYVGTDQYVAVAENGMRRVSANGG